MSVTPDTSSNAPDLTDHARIDEVVRIIANQYRDPDIARSAINDFRDWMTGARTSEPLVYLPAMQTEAGK